VPAVSPNVTIFLSVVIFPIVASDFGRPDGTNSSGSALVLAQNVAGMDQSSEKHLKVQDELRKLVP